jgi:hypothetical protein
MIAGHRTQGLLRGDGERDHRVSSMELFFDLVFVFAITQLSHLLLTHLDASGAFQTALLLLALWLAWIDTAWFTNWFDPDRRPVRFVLIGIMVASLIMAVALPEAFGDRGLLFAIPFVALQVGRFVFAVMATRDEPVLHRNFQRILAWRVVSGLLWLAGGLASAPLRTIFWVIAVAVDSSGPAFGFITPGLGRSTTRDWNISGAHMAERCELFIIIALGESILVTGGAFGQLDITPATLTTFVVAFSSVSRSGGSISISASMRPSAPSSRRAIPGGWAGLPTPIFIFRWWPGSLSPPLATNWFSRTRSGTSPRIWWPPCWEVRRCSWRGTCCSNMQCSAIGQLLDWRRSRPSASLR